jgi:hypothetical protein
MFMDACSGANLLYSSRQCITMKSTEDDEDDRDFHDYFIAEESGLWRCKGCGSTFENENECYRHMEKM